MQEGFTILIINYQKTLSMSTRMRNVFCILQILIVRFLMISDMITIQYINQQKRATLCDPFWFIQKINLCKIYLYKLVQHAASLQLLCFGRIFVLCRLVSSILSGFAQVPVPWLRSICGLCQYKLNVLVAFATFLY